MTLATHAPATGRVMSFGTLSLGRSRRVVERNFFVYRRGWIILASGFFEPLFYLLSIGLGLNHLVGDITVDGKVVTYTAFVAPALLATSAMNGALFDATFNLYFKLRISKTYDAILATPLGPDDVALGELLWCVVRGGIYAVSFLVVMVLLGYAATPWVILCIPAAIVMSFAFGAVGMAVTTYMRGFQDFDLVSLAMIPMFLFSSTFYPVTVYPGWLQAIVRATPFYQGVTLARDLDLGIFHWSLLIQVAYLATMAVVGFTITARRIRDLLLP
jgi:lipooligosaccharide transport system permease protein